MHKLRRKTENGSSTGILTPIVPFEAGCPIQLNDGAMLTLVVRSYSSSASDLLVRRCDYTNGGEYGEA